VSGSYRELHTKDYQLMEAIRGLRGMATTLLGSQVRIDIDLDHYQVLVAMMRSHRRFNGEEGSSLGIDVSGRYLLRRRISTTEQWLAWCAFRVFQFFKIRCDCLNSFPLIDHGAISKQTDFDILKRGVLWRAESLLDALEVVHCDDWPDQFDRRVRQTLNDCAARIGAELEGPRSQPPPIRHFRLSFKPSESTVALLVVEVWAFLAKRKTITTSKIRQLCMQSKRRLEFRSPSPLL
jgi:hypothetical protein